MKFTGSGIKAYIERLPPSGGPATPIGATAISKAAPAVVTVATGDAASLLAGDYIKVIDSGWPELDGKSFSVGTITADSFPLLGSDTTDASGTISPATTLTAIQDADLLLFCLTQVQRSVEAADAIDVSTFCGPESLAGTPTPGTLSVEGFVNYDEDAYLEWIQAMKDGQQRTFVLELPTSVGGVVIYDIVVSGFEETFQLDDACAFTGEAVIKSDPAYLVGPNAPALAA